MAKSKAMPKSKPLPAKTAKLSPGSAAKIRASANRSMKGVC